MKDSVNQVSIIWARANKPGLRDASLRKKRMWLIGDLYTLALSNTPMLPGSQTNPFLHTKGGKNKKGGEMYKLFLAKLTITQTCQLLRMFVVIQDDDEMQQPQH